MSHLIHAAVEMSHQAELSDTPIDWLILMVHNDNLRAIKLYEKCGFELVPDVLRRNNHRVMKLWIGDAE
jgi:ribosomal protein S18 acetylase RimI-like enzyme